MMSTAATETESRSALPLAYAFFNRKMVLH